MQKIDGTNILINRGDTLNVNLSLTLSDGTNYTFQVGDTIVFSIYEKGKLSDNAVLIKEFEVETSSETLNIELSNEETKIGNLINKPKDYWYEIELNDEYTVLGYDENGAKIFRLYPEGSQVL